MSQHTEWLGLIDKSGPFLNPTVLDRALPQGLAGIATPKRQTLREAYEEWYEAVEDEDPELDAIHDAWIILVLEDLLEYLPQVMKTGTEAGAKFHYRSVEHGTELVPNRVLFSCDTARLIVTAYLPGTDMEAPLQGESWVASPIERMTVHCRATGVRLGLVTNGDRWTLVNAPVGSTSGHASWYARYWFQEPTTLQAFQTLLEVRRFFGAPEVTLESLLEESLQHQEEVTDTLGEQVRRAVEVLVQSLDRADLDRNRELLVGVTPARLYEAGLTVMMRMVFLMCAEERGLLLLGDPVYDRCYAVTTLRSQLNEDADRLGMEVLERRHDAWSRLLSVFRGVYGGIEHESLRMPALGGSLFDPDRFPFLEGRAEGTTWRETSAIPLPIDNRTVLMLLSALQILEQRGGAQLLSYRELDVEQIGHVYEGLLEYTVTRLSKTTLGLIGTKKMANPNHTLEELEANKGTAMDTLEVFLTEATGRSATGVRSALSSEVPAGSFDRILQACGADLDLAERVKPFGNLLRKDNWGNPLIYKQGSFCVTHGANRRETGTHYTPKSLTEVIVAETLTPIVYIGPAEGRHREEWTLKSSAELLALKICDLAMGSGAFLVQVCRWLAERVVEAWAKVELTGQFITVDGDVVSEMGQKEPLPKDTESRTMIARRLIAERCLYGVDLNPLAVELGKLSIWLVTMAKGRPFGFLDHNLRSGDSLLGIYKLEQLIELSMAPSGKGQRRLFGQSIEQAINDAIALRTRLCEMPIRDIHDVEAMARLEAEARAKLEFSERIADAFIGTVFAADNPSGLPERLNSLAALADQAILGDANANLTLVNQAKHDLAKDVSEGRPRLPFHWPLMFPEVFKRGGFDGIVGNPPFMGGKKISGNLGSIYREFIVENIASGVKGNADLCAYFFLRSAAIVRANSVFGLLATNTISQGDTREVGLDQLLSHGTHIIRAIPSQKWPGKANLEIAMVWLYSSDTWKGLHFINNKHVVGISAYLVDVDTVIGTPFQLLENDNIAYVGQIVLGDGFVLTPEKASELIASDPRNKDVLFKYLAGEDVTSRPDQSPSRWVINFFDWPLKRKNIGLLWSNATEKQKKECLQEGVVPNDYPAYVAADFPECLQILINDVKPQRDKSNRKCYREKWWRYAERQPKLMEGLNGVERVLFHTFTGKYVAFTFTEKGIVFAGPHNVILLDQYHHFSVLQSSIHYVWVSEYCSTHETRIRYATSDVLKTFPFPKEIHVCETIGKKYYDYRQNLMLSMQQGLTETYNYFHDPNESSQNIQELRELHVEMDNSVVTAYGWDDLYLAHDFHETKQGIRFTMPEEARCEILRRLLKLNHELYEEEVAQGLHVDIATTRSPHTRKTLSETSAQTGIDFDSAVAVVSSDPILKWLTANLGWQSKNSILSGTGVPENLWKATIDTLLAEGIVERQGERRVERYRATKQGSEK